jgi:hypothetical protein
MGDLAQVFEFLIPVVALAAVLLAPRDSSRTTEILEYLVGATAGLQSIQLGGKVHLFTLACFLYVIVGGRTNQHRGGRSLALLAALGLLLMSFPLGSMTVSVAPALQLLALGLCSVALVMKATSMSINRMLYGLLAVCTIAAVVAVIQRLGLVQSNAVITNGFKRPYGIYAEPDWLGLYAAVGLVILARLSMSWILRSSIFVLLSAALLLSFARAAWLALAVVIVAGMVATLWVTAVSPHRRTTANRGNTAIIVTAVAGVLIVLASVNLSLVTQIEQRIFSSNSENQISVTARRNQYESLQRLADGAPWHGLGLSASGRVSAFGAIVYGGASGTVHNGPDVVATNWILGWWVDGKYLAVPIILLFTGLTLVTVRKTSGQILLLILVNSVFSNVILLPVTWFAVGLALVDLPDLAVLGLRRRPSALKGGLPGMPKLGMRGRP